MISPGSAPLDGSCACGAVRVRAHAAPRRAGLCHCRVCQKIHGSAFYAFAIFAQDQVTLTGETRAWNSTPGYTRLACAVCGARLGGLIGADLELSLSLFDAWATIEPQYESWADRRVPWLAPLPLTQYPHERTASP